MVNLEYANAYSEVLEILKHISQEDYNKIPKQKVTLFQTNCNKEYNFIYDINKTLDEQNVSKKAKTIIAILFRDYWASDVQREKIKAKEQYDRQIKEHKMRNKYSTEKIFQDSNIEDENILSDNNKVILYKEPLIKKIIKKIFNLLGLN